MARSWLGLALLAIPSAAFAGDEVVCDAPQVLIVLDKSSSMLGLTPSGATKWEAARDAIVQVTDGFGGTIDFGLMIFPDPDQCAPGSVAVDCAPGNASAIEEALGDPPPASGNYTPMAQSVEAAGAHPQLADPSRRSYVLLVTDGWQWCSPYEPDTRFTPVDAVAGLLERGLVTYVVGFGDSVDVLTLNRAAVAGGAAIEGCNPEGEDLAGVDHCYHQTDDLDGLVSTLEEIARHVTEEQCDGFDNDCDLLVDEDFDLDQDGATTCAGEYADCDDTRPEVRPGELDSCDGIDNDCDGTADPGCACASGATQACGTCQLGEQSCDREGAWGACVEPAAPPSEACNGEDDDCDGVADDEAACPDDGFACVDGRCVDLTPPDDGGEQVLPPDDESDEALPEPEPEELPVAPHDGTIEGGCACRVERGGSSALAPLLLAFVTLVLRRRR